MSFEPTDIVIGAKYVTWGGRMLTVLHFAKGEFHWRDDNGEKGSTSARGLAARIRKEISPSTATNS
jgi:hypothetical protein